MGHQRDVTALSTLDVLAGALVECPDRDAVVARSGRLTYAQLDEAADRATAALQSLGVRPGDRVAVCLPNDLDVVVTFHAVMRAGAVWVGVGSRLAPPEKGHILADAGVRLFLGDEPSVAEVTSLAATLPDLLPPVVVGDAASAWRAALAATDRRDRVDVRIDVHAPAAIAYTSGTTGLPKGVVHSHHNLVLPGHVIVDTFGWDATLRRGDCFPLTVLNMQVLTTLLVPTARGTSVLLDRVDAPGIATWVRDEQVTMFNAAPATLHDLVHDASVRPEDLASLREVISGGSGLSEAVAAAFTERFGLAVQSSYGLTEAPTKVSCERRGEHRAGSSGIVLPHLVVVTMDAGDRPLPPGAEGELCVRAATTGRWAGAYRPMLGYLDRPDATREALRGGWLRTGDIGRVDADGVVTVTDRKNLLIIRGSANVYPAEVERVLAMHPAVAASAVVGEPDERLGQRVGAYVQPAPGQEIDADALVAHCRAHLARYKVPEWFVVVPEMPRNSMGKIVRRDLPRRSSSPDA